MPSSTTEVIHHRDAVAAAMARHPAGRRRSHSDPLRFTDLVELLTGPWRVSDPDGFAAAMTGAPTLGGHAVTDAARGVPLDEALARATAGAAARDLDLQWVAGSHDGLLFVEARAQAGAGRGAPEVFVVAHLVEDVGAGRPGGADHSWVVLVSGDGSGGIGGILRATLSCPGARRCCPPPPGDVRLPLPAPRHRLVAPAVLAQGPAPAPDRGTCPSTVVPFRRRWKEDAARPGERCGP